jgi:hypothetical protein
MLLGALAGGVGMAVVMSLIRFPELRLSLAGWAATALGFVLVPLAALFVHEAGHVATGALAGFRPHLFIVGPFKLERRGGGWTAGVNRTFPWWGGLAGGTPNGTDRLRQRMLLLIAGGPGASVLAGAGALAAIAAAGLEKSDVLTGPAASAYLLVFVFGLASLLMGVIALVPGQGHGFSTDGGRLLRFMQKGPDAEGEVAVLGIVGSSMAGQRPRAWPPALIAQALGLAADSSQGTAARFLAHMHALDSGAIEEARRRLREALDHLEALPKMTQPAVLLSAAWFAAVHDGDAASARRFLDQAGQEILFSTYSRPLSEAAVLIAEGDMTAAGPLLDVAEREVPGAIDRGSAVMAADQVEYLRTMSRTGKERR